MTDFKPIGLLSPEVGATLLRKHITKGREILSARPISSDTESAWEIGLHDTLVRIYGSGSHNVLKVMRKHSNWYSQKSETELERLRASNIQTRITTVESLIANLDDIATIDCKNSKQVST